jgi:aryl-alcohol dehydrogenase-like predicted oxidoreductase
VRPGLPPAHGSRSAASPGASRPEQLKETLKAFETKLDPELKRKLDALTAEYRRGDSDR